MNRIIIDDVELDVLQGLKQIAWHRGLPLEEAIRQVLVDATRAGQIAFSKEPPNAGERSVDRQPVRDGGRR